MGIIKNTFIGIFTRVVVILILFINSLLILKVLGPKWQGIYFMITVSNGVLLNFFNLGMNISNTTFLAKDRYLFGKINSNAVIISLGSGIFSLGIYFIFYKFLHTHIFKDIDPNFMLIGVCLLPFTMYEVMWNSMMVGLNEIPLINNIQLIKNFLGLLLNIILLIIFGLGFYGAFYAWIVTTLVSALTMIYIGNRRGKLKIHFYPEIFKKMFPFGLKNYWGNISTYIWRRFDTYAINIFSGIVAVGYYSLAVNIRDIVWQLIEPVSNASFAKISELDRQNSARLTSRITRHIVLNSFILAAIFIVLGYLAIKFILGTAYIASIRPLIILLISSPAVGIAMVLSIYLIGQINKPGLVSVFAWLNTVINILLCLFLIPKYGITGAAVSFSIMCIIGTILMLLAFRRFSGYSIRNTVLLRNEDLIYYHEIFKKIKNRFGFNIFPTH